jgi:hypothetical protein
MNALDTFDKIVLFILAVGIVYFALLAVERLTK